VDYRLVELGQKEEDKEEEEERENNINNLLNFSLHPPPLITAQLSIQKSSNFVTHSMKKFLFF
jgi:hypothetical protein